MEFLPLIKNMPPVFQFIAFVLILVAQYFFIRRKSKFDKKKALLIVQESESFHNEINQLSRTTAEKQISKAKRVLETILNCVSDNYENSLKKTSIEPKQVRILGMAFQHLLYNRIYQEAMEMVKSHLGSSSFRSERVGDIFMSITSCTKEFGNIVSKNFKKGYSQDLFGIPYETDWFPKVKIEDGIKDIFEAATNEYDELISKKKELKIKYSATIDAIIGG
jgi:hypothetical protein